MTRRLPFDSNRGSDRASQCEVPMRKPVGRSLLAGVGVTLAGVALGGCSYLSPAQTQQSYDPADGAIASLGDVSINNVLVVSSAKGSRGEVQGMVTNNSNQAVTVKVAPAGGSVTEVSVPAQSAVRLDSKSNGDDTATTKAVSISRTTAAPGEHTTVTFASAQGGQINVSVPVLLDQSPYGSASPSHAE